MSIHLDYLRIPHVQFLAVQPYQQDSTPSTEFRDIQDLYGLGVQDIALLVEKLVENERDSGFM